VDGVLFRTKVGQVVKSLREGTFLEKNLSIVTLGAVDVLESKLISSFSLSLKEDIFKVSKETLLEIGEAEILFEEFFAI